MKTIWKYPLEIIDDQILQMPQDAEILTVQVQFGKPCLWVLVDIESNPGVKHIRIYGTGHSISDNDKLKYISTFQIENGSLIFHVFEFVL